VSALWPIYGSNDEDSAAGHGEERLIRLLGIREFRSRFLGMIRAAEKVLRYQFSPIYVSLIYSYLYLLVRRVPLIGTVEVLPVYNLTTPAIYHRAAAALYESDPEGIFPEDSERGAEIALLARILSACEVGSASTKSADELLNGLAEEIGAIIEHALGRLERSRKIWLHDDRPLLNYLRLTLAAAARRIDLGLPEWKELGLHALPEIEDSPAAAVLCDQFTRELGETLCGRPGNVQLHRCDGA
jgi:hypothetical protein